MRHMLLLCCCLLAIACGDGNSPDAPVDEGPRRILSLSPHATQMLDSFGVMDEVVGVTDYCSLPESHSSIPRVGALMNPNVELMLSLRPTVVFHAPTANGPEGRLAAAGIRVVPLANESLSDIHVSIEMMGQELGMEEQGAGIVASSRGALDALARELADAPRPTVLFVIGHAPGTLRDIHAAGPNTFLDELITIAGGDNLMADAPTRYPQVSRESLIQRPPNVILMAAPPNGWVEGEQEFLTTQWRSLLGAGAEGVRVEFLNSATLTIPGPSVHQSARQLARLLHPEVAED